MKTPFPGIIPKIRIRLLVTLLVLKIIPKRLPVFQLSSSQLTSLLGTQNGGQVLDGQKYIFELGETSKKLTWVEPGWGGWVNKKIQNNNIISSICLQITIRNRNRIFVETQDLQPVGSFPSTTNENTSSGDNTENQDTTSGNTSNTESTSTTDNNSLAYSGKDGSEPSEDLRQDIFDALWTQMFSTNHLHW